MLKGMIFHIVRIVYIQLKFSCFCYWFLLSMLLRCFLLFFLFNCESDNTYSIIHAWHACKSYALHVCSPLLFKWFLLKLNMNDRILNGVLEVKRKKLWSIVPTWNGNTIITASMNKESWFVPRNLCIACDKICHWRAPFYLCSQTTNLMITECLPQRRSVSLFPFLCAFRFQCLALLEMRMKVNF